MEQLIIRNGHVVDPSQGLDGPSDLLILNGRVAAIGSGLEAASEAIEFDARGLIVCPGLIDMHVQLREPGFEEDETITTGTRAALAGGFSSICCLPNTEPPIDTQASVEFVQHQAARADNCRVWVAACASKGRLGDELSEIGSLHKSGAVAVTDAPSSIHNPDLMRRALEYCQMFDLPLINQPEVKELTRGGVMHDGVVSTLLGLPGLPSVAEDVMTGRDICLAQATGGQVHLAAISSQGSIDLIQRAKLNGIRVTAGTAIANLVLTEESLQQFDANYKVNPPLRSADHQQACIAGLADGTLDVLTSAHAPRAREKKMLELDLAPFGISGLETVVPLALTHLIHTGRLDWSRLVSALSMRPAEILNLRDLGSLRIGCLGDVTCIDPQMEWSIQSTDVRSKSKNSPFLGVSLRGGVDAVFVGGRLKFSRRTSVPVTQRRPYAVEHR